MASNGYNSEDMNAFSDFRRLHEYPYMFKMVMDRVDSDARSSLHTTIPSAEDAY